MTYTNSTSTTNSFYVIKPPTLHDVVAEYLKRIGVKDAYSLHIEEDILLGIDFLNDKDRFVFELAGNVGRTLIDLEHEYRRRRAFFNNTHMSVAIATGYV